MKLAAETVERLISDVPQESRQILHERLITYLDYSSKMIPVRKGRRRFRVVAAAIVDNLDDYTGADNEILSESDITEYIEPLAMFPDMIWLGQSVGALRSEGEKLSLDRDPIDAIIREQIDHKLGSISIKKPRKPVPWMGSDPNVAARRAELSNMMRSKRHVTDREICRRWKSKHIGLPDNWQSDGIPDWEVALKLRPNNVHKLISVDRTLVRTRLQGADR